ncbi:hypothetical protein PGO_000985 [Plasmodium gonderi]|uniref:Variable surface protein n=1 Tax=Plasmodium gonderi TaxID=77519 RepID=A0A1Y1JTJ7_PLAGO|nr:hypothetical protein PGO_000985 [Plasmodium gonderi]GAW84082.1 hypothetical protein PGO_000985 [Plasmodium gonderi]
MGRSVVVFINDDQSSTTQTCHDNYVDILVKFEREHPNLENENCISLCEECYKIYEFITTLKNQCFEKISALAGSYAVKGLTSYCKRCDVNYRYDIDDTCCNDKKYELKSGTNNICKVNVINIEQIVSELEKHELKPQMAGDSDELKASEDIDFPAREENSTNGNEASLKNEVLGNKQQELINTSDLESLSVPGGSPNAVLHTSENAESLGAVPYLENNTKSTQGESNLSASIPQNNTQDNQYNSLEDYINYGHVAAYEIINAVHSFYKAFVYSLLPLISSQKSATNNLQTRDEDKMLTGINSICANHKVNNNLSPVKYSSQFEYFNDVSTGQDISGSESADTDKNITLSATVEGIHDAGNYGIDSNENITQNGKSPDITNDLVYLNYNFHSLL